ncbi:hypothetical protein WICPIJ_001960 [Wickerhamomyces pijperi]|uniref:Uncharacterized protein n=1 Tax=Wickerhamomyces pijperi TaxID=599730 RepID=A0A9P8Q9U4_WICPI|nr:hypothetical protein WICPIJ_001960 [Wickerhamomyces pijperi]
MIPNDQTSTSLGSYSAPFMNSSGETYGSEPQVPVERWIFFSQEALKTAAVPKSDILAIPVEVKRTFSGFKSQWATPAVCMKWIPLRICLKKQSLVI